MNLAPLPITILHTNDMHSYLEAMSRLSSFAKRLRSDLEAQGRIVFFFDAGDAADRRIRFVGASKGSLFPPIVAAMGYDVQALGNVISVTYGPQAAARMAKQASYPILAANFFNENIPQLDGFQPVYSFSLPGGLRLGVVGLTVQAPEIFEMFGLNVSDYRESARYWAAELRDSGRGPVIALTHVGVREDRQLAEDHLDVDVIIGGHSHTLLENGETINGILIAQTGEYAKYLGQIDLSIDPISGEVLEKSAHVLEVPPDEPLDPAVEVAIHKAEAEAQVLLQRPVGSLQEALDLDYFSECSVADLGADVLRERMEGDVAILTSGVFHRGLPAGTVTLGDLDAACFSTANPQRTTLRGEQIWAALERAVDPAFMHQHLKMLRGAPVGMPAISGMAVEYDPAAENGRRIRRIKIHGRPIDLQASYRVAHTDGEVIYGQNDYGYFKPDADQPTYTEVPTIIRETIEDYLRLHSPVPRPQGGRWIIRQDSA